MPLAGYHQAEWSRNNLDHQLRASGFKQGAHRPSAVNNSLRRQRQRVL
jgi:hypothetical protein